VGDIIEEIRCIVDYLGRRFVKIFAEFSPEAVEHEFGCGFASWIFGNESWIEVDALVSGVVNIDDVVFHFNGFDEFWCAPGTV